MKFVIYSLLMTVLAFSFSAQAKKTKIKTVTTTTTTTKTTGTAAATDDKYQTMDLKQFDDLKDQSTGINVKANLNCKSSSGTEYKSGEVGYDQCVRASGKSGQLQNNEQKATNNMEINLGK